MKHQPSLRRRLITDGSENASWVSERVGCLIIVIIQHVSTNPKVWYGTWIMCHVHRFTWYSWVELELKIIQDRFLSKHGSQRPYRCSAPIVGLECFHWSWSAATARWGQAVTWREWGLYFYAHYALSKYYQKVIYEVIATLEFCLYVVHFCGHFKHPNFIIQDYVSFFYDRGSYILSTLLYLAHTIHIVPRLQ